MICFYLLLIYIDDVEVHFTNTTASVLKPIHVQELINIQAILFSVALKELSLRYDIVLCLLLFFLIDEVGTLSCLVA